MLRNAKTNFLQCIGYLSFTKDRIKLESLPTLALALQPLHENANLRFFTNICKCKQLPLVIFAGNLWTPEHEWNYRMSLSIRNATPKDLQMQGIYFHIFEQIMSSSEIYHIFDVSLSTYFFLETYIFDHLFAIMHKDSLLPRFTMKNGFWKTL